MLNPNLVPGNYRKKIIDAFQPLLNRDIKSVRDELASLDRMVFEKTVMKAFGIEEYLAPIIYSLLSMQNTRHTAVTGTIPLNSDIVFGDNEIARIAKIAESII